MKILYEKLGIFAKLVKNSLKAKSKQEKHPYLLTYAIGVLVQIVYLGVMISDDEA